MKLYHPKWRDFQLATLATRLLSGINRGTTCTGFAERVANTVVFSRWSCFLEAVDKKRSQLWQRLFSNPLEWWDDRLSKSCPSHPDFVCKLTKELLWLTM